MRHRGQCKAAPSAGAPSAGPAPVRVSGRQTLNHLRLRRTEKAAQGHRLRRPPALLDQGQILSDFQVHHLAKDLGAKATNHPFAVGPVVSSQGAQLVVLCSGRLGIVQLVKLLS